MHYFQAQSVFIKKAKFNKKKKSWYWEINLSIQFQMHNVFFSMQLLKPEQESVYLNIIITYSLDADMWIINNWRY